VGAAESARGVDPIALPQSRRTAGFLLVVSGPSGVGKGTMVERLLAARPECTLSISTTTRPRRAHETDGVQYHFVSQEEFERRRAAGQFLEWAEVHGQLYATPRAFVEENLRQGRVVVLEVDVQGGASVRRAQQGSVSVFICPPTIEALRERLGGRGTDPPDVIERRLGNATFELSQWKDYDYLVWNEQLEPAVALLVAIVDAERSRIGRLIDPE
jgi:guanylate kinase